MRSICPSFGYIVAKRGVSIMVILRPSKMMPDGVKTDPRFTGKPDVKCINKHTLVHWKKCILRRREGGVFIKVDGLAAYTSIGIIMLQCVASLLQYIQCTTRWDGKLAVIQWKSGHLPNGFDF